ncbi:MAG: hypothetical protein OXK80_00090 [Bdellovibrionales bacterium]|nr:hypothetical protein [Bdellovibrionales bacterium]
MGQGSSARVTKRAVRLPSFISFPSKTFLIGEYAVMEGAPALLVNTRPRFQFDIQYPVKKSFHPFHKDSPAGLLIEENKKVFSSVSIQYSQNYKSGFGLSGAEFNCVYLLSALFKGVSVEDIDCLDILEKYLSFVIPDLIRNPVVPVSLRSAVSVGTCTASSSSPHHTSSPRRRGSSHSIIPSGADIVSQWLGKVCIFSKPSIAESMDWPFRDLSFALIRTGENLQTWKHLENLKQKNFSQLKEISFVALEALRSSSESLFVQSIQDYRKALEEESLIHPSTTKILQELDSHPEILAAKGCGAMGAEVISVFFRKDAKNLNFLKNYNCISGLQSLDQGVLVNYDKR